MCRQQKAGGDEGGALVVPGAQAFLLYDSFGFPLELTVEIAAERGATVDVAGFEAAMQEQRRRSKDAAKVRCSPCLDSARMVSPSCTTYQRMSNMISDSAL